MKSLKEVMQALVSGKKLRKTFWDKDVHCHFNNEGNLVVNYKDSSRVIKHDVFENYLSYVEDIEIYYPWFNVGDQYYFDINPNVIYTVKYVDENCLFAKTNNNKIQSSTRDYYEQNLRARITIISN